jgi:hypothetical protein
MTPEADGGRPLAPVLFALALLALIVLAATPPTRQFAIERVADLFAFLGLLAGNIAAGLASVIGL